MQTLVLWTGMLLTTAMFITALIQYIRIPAQNTATILYEKQSYKRKQWYARLATASRWGFVMAAIAAWCSAIGYMGYAHIVTG